MKVQTTPFSKRIWTQEPTAALHGNVRKRGNGIIPCHLGPKHFVIIHSQSKALKHSAALPGKNSRSSKLNAHCLAFNPGSHTWGQGHTASFLKLTDPAVTFLSKSKHSWSNSLPDPPPNVCSNTLTFELGLLEHLHLADIDIVQRVNGLTGLLDVLANAVWDPEKSQSTTTLKNSACFCSSNTGLKKSLRIPNIIQRLTSWLQQFSLRTFRF